MAFVPYFVLSPSFIMSMIGLLYGQDETVPTPKENWHDVLFDLTIPTYNEETNIVLCLSSIKRQTIQPREIILCDDMSTDRTVEFALKFAAENQMNIRVVQHTQKKGKTLALYEIAQNSTANVVGVVDGDTIIKSENYFERLIQELFQGVGIGSACGMVKSLTELDRHIEYQDGHLEQYYVQNRELELSPDQTLYQRLLRAISNGYRNELYFFLQRVIYRAEMKSFGTLIFPIGCAAIYRRVYLHNILEHYIRLFGYDISDSEDIFIGFAFARQGYRNIHVSDVLVATLEPRFSRLFQQIFKWSSAYYQCCFYFNSLFLTPIKWPSLLMNKWRNRHTYFREKRQVKEAYRQVFGTKYTQKYGRHIGWFIFTTALEKISFPTILVILIIFKLWSILLFTYILETSFRAFIVLLLCKKQRVKYFLGILIFSPINYTQVLFDLVVLSRFMIDLWVTKNRKWRK